MNNSDKETSVLDLYKMLLEVAFISQFTSNAMTLDRVPIVDFLWLSVDITGLPSCGFYISQLVRFARCCSIAFLISILKIFKTIQNYWRSVTDITNFEKHFEVSLDHTRPELLSNGSISFQEYACMFQQEFFARYSTIIWSTNKGESNSQRIPSRRARK